MNVVTKNDHARAAPLCIVLLNYNGWRDTLATPANSQRQYDYAKARGDMDVYTPQMIVNGAIPVVGNQRSEVYAVLGRPRTAAWKVPLNFSANGNEIAIEMGQASGVPESTLWVMALQAEATARIEKGELAGHEITYHNIVRRMVPAGMWQGQQRVVLPKDGILPPEANICVALLQTGKAGPVLGAAVWEAGVS